MQPEKIDWEKEFCEKFCTPEFIVRLDARLKYVKNVNALHEIHDFIRNLLASHTTSLRTAIAGMKKEIPTPNDNNDVSDIHAIGYNIALTEVLALLD